MSVSRLLLFMLQMKVKLGTDKLPLSVHLWGQNATAGAFPVEIKVHCFLSDDLNFVGFPSFF